MGLVMKKTRDPAWRQQVGVRLQQSLVAINKKPAEIARLYKMSQQRLSNYMTGARPLDIELAMNLSGRFGITLEWLYMGDMKSLPYDLAQRIVPIDEEHRHAAN